MWCAEAMRPCGRSVEGLKVMVAIERARFAAGVAQVEVRHGKAVVAPAHDGPAAAAVASVPRVDACAAVARQELLLDAFHRVGALGLERHAIQKIHGVRITIVSCADIMEAQAFVPLVEGCQLSIENGVRVTAEGGIIQGHRIASGQCSST